MNKTGRGKIKYKSDKQKSALNNTEMLYKSREAVIEFFDDYSSMVCEAKHEVTKEERLKILTPKKSFKDYQ